MYIDFLGLFLNNHFSCVYLCDYFFGQLLEDFGLLYTLKCGHTVQEAKTSLSQEVGRVSVFSRIGRKVQSRLIRSKNNSKAKIKDILES